MKLTVHCDRLTIGDTAFFMLLVQTPALLEDAGVYGALIAALDRLVEGGVCHYPHSALGPILETVMREVIAFLAASSQPLPTPPSLRGTAPYGVAIAPSPLQRN